jgi:hypothetical protein
VATATGPVQRPGAIHLIAVVPNERRWTLQWLRGVSALRCLRLCEAAPPEPHSHLPRDDKPGYCGQEPWNAGSRRRDHSTFINLTLDLGGRPETRSKLPSGHLPPRQMQPEPRCASWLTRPGFPGLRRPSEQGGSSDGARLGPGRL